MIRRQTELRAGAVFLALLLTLATAQACKTVGTPPTGDTSTAAQTARLTEVAHLVDLSEKTVDLVAALQQTEIEVYKAKLVTGYTAEQHEATQGAFVKFAQEVQADVVVAKDIAQADATRRTAVAAIARRAKALADTIQIDNPLVKAGVNAIFVVVEMLNLSA